jgi:excisionase family DNA binding protein
VPWYPTNGPWYKTGVKKPKSYTITEAAKKLGISRQAVHLAISNRQLKANKTKVVQTIWLIPESALQDYRVSASHKWRGKKN